MHKIVTTVESQGLLTETWVFVFSAAKESDEVYEDTSGERSK